MSNLISAIRKMPDKTGYLLIAPFYIVFIYFSLIPVVQVIYQSFTNYVLFGDSQFIFLKNYIELFQDYYFKKSIVNTLVYTAGTLLPSMVIGFAVALLVNTSAIRTKLFRTIIFTPHVFSMVTVAMVWLLIFDPAFGYFNYILSMFGMEPLRWLQSPNTAMLAIIIMSVWKGIGYNMVINLAGLSGIPETFNEVARIEGASFWQKLRYVTIPMMSSTTFFLFVTGMIGSFNVFEQVNIMTNGGPADATTTVVHQIYTNAFAYYNMGYASAQSVALLVIVMGITIVNMMVGRKYADVEMG